jgi:hypothetical protein
MPGHTKRNTTSYKVYGTNENYSGMTVEVGGFLYSTMGGALEGDSMQLVATAGSNPNMNTNQIPSTQNNSNPVVRTFRNRFQEPTPGDRIYEYIRMDGSPGAMNLHEHQDGTIMEGHNPNDMGVVVMLNPIFGTINPNQNMPPVIGGNGGSENTTPGGPRDNRMNQGSGGGGSY